MKASVIISTLNNPRWLEKVLWGYEAQSYTDFEIVIADDGSEEPTRQLIDRFKAESKLNLIHVWHPRNGYQKCVILNKALQAAASEYLIFTDGDCIPRHDFVERHILNAKQGYYLSGGIVRLPMTTSEKLTQEDVRTGRAFDLRFLIQHGHKSNFLKNLKLELNGIGANVMNALTTRKATWNGCNSSGWKSDLLAVNGFNESMHYGGQDVECGYRLNNRGIKGKQLVYSLAAIHLDHSRGYKTEESIRKNKQIIRETKSSGVDWTPFGIAKTVQAGQ